MSDDVTSITLDEAKDMESQTDWDALEEKTDEEIREAVESDPDAHFLDEEWFENAELVNPSAEKERISIRLDEDILEFFRAGGKGYQSRINKVLREYMAVQKHKRGDAHEGN
ncbi:BrnA antitoxin family protein [Salinibacter ruber]|uniref:BrnA antitoxin family protein n=1 Tax=Salinibacter ruber TaxID=146919 RepID=UPI0020746C3D|nr:BrnA antitoxin family protein [Salinibacter ruber]